MPKVHVAVRYTARGKEQVFPLCDTSPRTPRKWIYGPSAEFANCKRCRAMLGLPTCDPLTTAVAEAVCHATST